VPKESIKLTNNNLKSSARPRESVAMKAILKLQKEEKKSIEVKIEVQDQRQDKIK
jgi:hypothetical protein